MLGGLVCSAARRRLNRRSKRRIESRAPEVALTRTVGCFVALHRCGIAHPAAPPP